MDWALELAFRPGGTMIGARALGPDMWQLDAIASAEAGKATAEYRAGTAAIVSACWRYRTVAARAMPAAHAVPAYEPGEEYRFLGGTDAATGERLYVAGRVPARVRMKINVTRA